jgi:excisionase family DNA binding protein
MKQTRNTEELLTYAELAKRLQLSVWTVRQKVAAKLIPAIRISHTVVRFDWEDVRRALGKVTVREAGAR